MSTEPPGTDPQFSPTEISRYRRQLSLAGFGRAAQARLHAGHVAVIGAGGLGSPALLYLAGAGIGRITVFDDDTVGVSNLHRQVIHTDAAARANEPKAESARRAMLALNPTVQVNAVSTRLNADNAEELLADADVVLDGSDNFATRYLASYACARRGIPHVWASILGFDAQMTVFWADRGPIYEDLFPTPPPAGSVPSCSQAGVLGPVVGTVGSAMALEALKLLTGVGDPLIGQLGYFSALDGTWEYIPVNGDPSVAERIRAHGPVTDAPATEEPTTSSPAAYPDVHETETIPAGALVLDVRNPDEVATFALDGSVKCPLPRLREGYTPAEVTAALDNDQTVVVHCAGGVRSAEAVHLFHERGLTGPLYSLRGGIDAWLDSKG
ncbi:ThiF family adenylyltransferase [Corynebacterium confusum]